MNIWTFHKPFIITFIVSIMPFHFLKWPLKITTNNVHFRPNIFIIMYEKSLSFQLWISYPLTFTFFTLNSCPAALTATITISCYSVTVPRDSTSYAAVLYTVNTVWPYWTLWKEKKIKVFVTWTINNYWY